jgi:hypothetical protein
VDGHKLRLPLSKKAQFVTDLGISFILLLAVSTSSRRFPLKNPFADQTFGAVRNISFQIKEPPRDFYGGSSHYSVVMARSPKGYFPTVRNTR